MKKLSSFNPTMLDAVPHIQILELISYIVTNQANPTTNLTPTQWMTLSDKKVNVLLTSFIYSMVQVVYYVENYKGTCPASNPLCNLISTVYSTITSYFGQDFSTTCCDINGLILYDQILSLVITPKNGLTSGDLAVDIINSCQIEQGGKKSDLLSSASIAQLQPDEITMINYVMEALQYLASGDNTMNLPPPISCNTGNRCGKDISLVIAQKYFEIDAVSDQVGNYMGYRYSNPITPGGSIVPANFLMTFFSLFLPTKFTLYQDCFDNTSVNSSNFPIFKGNIHLNPTGMCMNSYPTYPNQQTCCLGMSWIDPWFQDVVGTQISWGIHNSTAVNLWATLHYLFPTLVKTAPVNPPPPKSPAV